MKKFFKILFSIILGIVFVFFALLGTYVVVNWQGVIEPFQVGNPDTMNKILIASQGSEFKNNLLDNLVQQLETEDNYLYVVDCTKLDSENVADWDAIVIIHSAQMHELPGAAELFLKRAADHSKVMLVSTSGAGDDKIEGFAVDAVSTASHIEITHKVINWLMPRIESRLNNLGTNNLETKDLAVIGDTK